VAKPGETSNVSGNSGLPGKQGMLLFLPVLSTQKSEGRLSLKAKKIHQTGFFICFLLSGVWVRGRQKTFPVKVKFWSKRLFHLK